MIESYKTNGTILSKNRVDFLKLTFCPEIVAKSCKTLCIAVACSILALQKLYYHLQRRGEIWRDNYY